MKRLFTIFVLVLYSLNKSTAICPNSCSGHGICQSNNGVSSYACSCFPGYIGIDCSLRTCPSGTAWVDIPTSNDTAHAPFTECSNMGKCDRSKGICSCRDGFTGDACQRTLCPYTLTPESVITFGSQKRVCSGNGRCMSLRQASVYNKFITEGNNPEEYSDWDADMIYGCVCERGWEGPNCDRKSCPKGIDPVFGGGYETQFIECKCIQCTGALRIIVDNEITGSIPYNARRQVVQFYLQKLTGLQNIELSFLLGDQLCSSTGSVLLVKFIVQTSPLNTMRLIKIGGLDGHIIQVRSKGQVSTLAVSKRTSSAESVFECSGRGTCDYSSGTCDCFTGFGPSDGRGNTGKIGDCGFKNADWANYVNVSDTLCPFDDVTQMVCSGHGVCNIFNNRCDCDSGYGGPLCSDRTCGLAHRWFGDVGKAHSNVAECAGVGDCDRTTGICSCSSVFSGDSCEYFSCAKDELGRACSGNGTCLSLRNIAEYSYNEQKQLSRLSYTNWDADSILGCLCSRAISVDNVFSQEYLQYALHLNTYNKTANNSATLSTADYSDADLVKYYRGPYSHAATDFKGYLCDQAFCPTGDDPRTYGVNEIQKLHCRAGSGSFTLKFRENVTRPIPVHADAQDVKVKLDEIFTIGFVSVSIAQNATSLNSSVCNSVGNNTIYVEFLTEFGDLPLLEVDTSNLEPGNAGILYFNITEYQKGTKEDLECSTLGLCNESLGVCKCTEGYGSSDGTVTNSGERGDCTFFNKFYTEAVNYRKRK